jgi:hypothetical protein
MNFSDPTYIRICINETSGFIKCGKDSSMELVVWLVT